MCSDSVLRVTLYSTWYNFMGQGQDMEQVRYFKEEIESTWGGEGVGYYEYTGEFCTRQIKVFSTRIELYRQERGNINLNMTDQRLTENTFARSDEISQSEFENMWEKGSQTN